MVSPPNDFILETRDLTVEIGGQAVIRKVSFQIRAGESIAVIGPNGAGKTTLLKALAGLLPGSPAGIFLRGQPLERLARRDIAHLIGYVPQLSERLISCTVLDYVLLSRYAHRTTWLGGVSRIDREKAIGVLAETGTTAFAERDIATLSGGERQKVMIAAALVQEAPLLFLDEPTSFLDYRQAGEVADLLARLNRDNGLTVISVVHDLNQGALQSTRILALNRGELVFQGTPAELLENNRLETVYGISFEIVKHERTRQCLLIPNPSKNAPRA